METTLKSNSGHETKSIILVREYSNSLPIDLLIEIFLRVPSKSIARFRCVSKFWASILRRPDFTEVFLTRSSTRPRLLFTFNLKNKLLFYSSPQPQKVDENMSLVATHHQTYVTKQHSYVSGGHALFGFVYHEERARKHITRVICNPITRKSIELPKLKGNNFTTMIGYDPIGKKFKVLCICFSSFDARNNNNWILTLETGECLWRKIECNSHSSENRGICINGVLYYIAMLKKSFVIVRFEVRSEKFDFINRDKDMKCYSLINYKGKLGAISDPYKRNLVLWVLEDYETHKWSKNIFVLPLHFFDIPDHFYVVGMIGTDEIVFSQSNQSKDFYIIFYNFVKNTFARVNIQGFDDLTSYRLNIFLDYVENIKLM